MVEKPPDTIAAELIRSLEERRPLIHRVGDRVSAFRIKLLRSKATIEIRPLGILNKYVLLELNVEADLSSSEIHQVLKTAANGLKELGVTSYVDLTVSSVEEAFLKGFVAGLTSTDILLVHYNYDGLRGENLLLILVNTSREDKLQKLVESIIRLIDKALEPLISVRRKIRESLGRLKDIADKIYVEHDYFL